MEGRDPLESRFRRSAQLQQRVDYFDRSVTPPPSRISNTKYIKIFTLFCLTQIVMENRSIAIVQLWTTIPQKLLVAVCTQCDLLWCIPTLRAWSSSVRSVVRGQLQTGIVFYTVGVVRTQSSSLSGCHWPSMKERMLSQYGAQQRPRETQLGLLNCPFGSTGRPLSNTLHDIHNESGYVHTSPSVSITSRRQHVKFIYQKIVRPSHSVRSGLFPRRSYVQMSYILVLRLTVKYFVCDCRCESWKMASYDIIFYDFWIAVFAETVLMLIDYSILVDLPLSWL